MRLYKILHKPTGMFYLPGSRTNLSRIGKVYTRVPYVFSITDIRMNKAQYEQHKTNVDGMKWYGNTYFIRFCYGDLKVVYADVDEPEWKEMQQ